MEPEIVAFLKKIALTIFITFCWLAVTAAVGVKFDVVYVEQSWTVGNILYYLWLTGSFIALLIFFMKMWKNTTKW